MASTLPKHYTKTLKNDLQVVAIPLENGSGVVTVNVFYNVGSGKEQLGKSGLAHMLEHMSFKSTKNMKAGEFDKIVKAFGGVNNASTGFDYTHYFIKTTEGNMDKSLSLFADMMVNLSLKDDEFQPERSVVAEERRWRTDNNPFGFLFFNLFNLAYQHHPYHWTPIGFMGDIENWDIEDLKEFYEEFYSPKNAIVLVAGDFDKDSFFASTEKHFGKLKNKKTKPRKSVVEPEQFGPRSATIYKESEVEIVALAWHIPPYDHKDITPLNALASLLSDGLSSRLQEKLVDKMQVANSISSYVMELTDPGLFVIIAVANAGVEATLLEAEILKEIELIKQKTPSKEELSKIKINAKSEFVYSFDNSSKVARVFGDYLARGNIEPLLDYENSLDRLEAEDITQVAKSYLVDRTKTTIILKKGE